MIQEIQSNQNLTRSYSSITQQTFCLIQSLNFQRLNAKNPIKRNLASAGYKIALPFWNRIKHGKWVRGRAYGRELMMPAEHQLVPTIAAFPLFNRPLALAAKILAESGKVLSIVDVGANIGETVAAIEQVNPGRCTYFCVEPEPDLAQLCYHNHASNKQVLITRAFVGEDNASGVTLEDNGLANPSTKFSNETSSQRLQRLDDLLQRFAEQHSIDLIKTDTEGFDFTILRSAETILRKYRPSVYFEWYPDLLEKLGEKPESIFQFLEELGYCHWVFFTSRGELHCELSKPTERTLQVLAKVAHNRADINYFDVFSSPDENNCRSLANLSLESQQSICVNASTHGRIK